MSRFFCAAMGTYDELKAAVQRANIELNLRSMVFRTWGNVSQISRADGIVAIKPSGVGYDELTPDKVVLVDLDGKIVQGDLRPSSDTPTHLELYRSFGEIGGVCHTHSMFASMWAQACRSIPALGTTGADYFHGAVPVTRCLTEEETRSGYEISTGRVIVERFAELDPGGMPAVLVANHGPFTWGGDGRAAVEAAEVLERVAELAFGTLLINPRQESLPGYLLDKHYFRKHGKDAYYGQV